MSIQRNLPKSLLSLSCAAAISLSAVSGQALAAPLDLSDQPLFQKTGVAPNFIIILDDSGSMSWNYMPNDRSNSWNRRFYSIAFNAMAYDPTVEYLLPLDENGAELDANGTSADTNFTAYDNGFTQNNLRNLGTSYPNNIGNSAAFYAQFDNTNNNCNGSIWDNDCYDEITVTATTAPTGVNGFLNFARWYAFYRTRQLATITAASRTMHNLGTGIRIGWQSLNNPVDTSTNPDTWLRTVRTFQGAHRTSFYSWLFNLPASGGTPLRSAVQRAGEYYRTAQPYYNDPADSNSGSYSCRPNYHLLMTDGQWNGWLGDNGPGNADNTATTLPDGTAYTPMSPYRDTNSGRSGGWFWPFY